MHLSFTLFLPHEEASVPIVRHLCRSTLQWLGVEQACIDDIEVALSEASTNVLRHATHSEYVVQVTLDRHSCTIDVVDTGSGLQRHEREQSEPFESGRGISLMKELVDDLNFVTRSEGGTVVTLTKTLTLHPASVMNRLGRPRQDA